MAERPVFIAGGDGCLVEQEVTIFQFFSGFSDAQKKRCIESLHQSFLRKHPQWRVHFRQHNFFIELAACFVW